VSGPTPDDQNFIRWRRGPDLPHEVTVFDPTGKLPKTQLSWR
jgi:RES domain-containing protein